MPPPQIEPPQKGPESSKKGVPPQKKALKGGTWGAPTWGRGPQIFIWGGGGIKTLEAELLVAPPRIEGGTPKLWGGGSWGGNWEHWEGLGEGPKPHGRP